jgi:Protein of unknown function (DUF3313)
MVAPRRAFARHSIETVKEVSMSLASISRRLAALALALWGGCALAGSVPETTHDGLQLVPSKKVQVLYVKPGATLAPYRRIAITDCYVAFRKNWQRDQNTGALRITAKDMEKIKTGLAEECRKAFIAELQGKGGFELVDQGGEDVLVLRPALINLDVAAPDTMTAGRSRSFATSAGSMTLYLELFDGASGEILARVVDPKEARDNGRMMWQNSVTNRAEADRMLARWAQLLHEGLDHAREQPAPAAPAASP